MMRRMWRLHPRLTLAFVLASAMALFFAGRVLWSVAYWAEHRQEPVAGWMTAGYVGRSWGLDPREIDAQAGLPAPQGSPLTLEEIARAQGVPVATVVAAVEAAIAALQAQPDAPP